MVWFCDGSVKRTDHIYLSVLEKYAVLTGSTFSSVRVAFLSLARSPYAHYVS